MNGFIKRPGDESIRRIKASKLLGIATPEASPASVPRRPRKRKRPSTSDEEEVSDAQVEEKISASELSSLSSLSDEEVTFALDDEELHMIEDTVDPRLLSI